MNSDRKPLAVAKNSVEQTKRDARAGEEAALFDLIAESLYSGAFSDILDEMGYPDQALDPASGIRPLDPGFVLVGRVFTLLNARDSRTEEPYELAIEAMDRMEAGQVLVAAAKCPLKCGIFGELSAARVRERGGQGALIDGFTRDGRRLLGVRFPTFCRGGSPIDTTGRARVVDYQVPVEVGGARIEPGQMVFADMDGILVIPREIEFEAIEKALERASVENQVRDELRSGATLNSVWRKHRIL